LSYAHCTARLIAAAGRALTDDEVRNIYERIHRAALDIKAGRTTQGSAKMGQPVDNVIATAAREAAAQLIHEAEVKAKQAHHQLVALGARVRNVDDMTAAGIPHLDAVERVIARDYTGRVNVESIEQRVAGHRAALGRDLTKTWEALGNDFLGFFQDRAKLIDLVKELRGEDTGNPLAARGAKAFHDTAEKARQSFNQAGGDIGRLDDWGMPQHHSQERVAAAGKDAWTQEIMPLLDRARYVDDAGVPFTDQRVRDFLGKAWETIATNGHANAEPGMQGAGKRANRHAESRQVHFKDADAVIGYWERFGEKAAFDILTGHIETMARDIAFIEHFGPNPDVTYQTLRDLALSKATKADPKKTESLEGRAVKLDILYDYAAGRITPSANMTLSKVADGIAHLNTAGKLGGAALASLFGDKPMMEAVRHLNNMPALQSWRTELSLLNPANKADRRLIQTQGLMLDSVRSGLTRFYEGLGQNGFTGKMANAVMRVTGMQAINDIRKASFGLSLMSAIGNEISGGRAFADLPASDMRLLRNYGINASDWGVWKLARLERIAGVDGVLTPEGISRISDADLQRAAILPAGPIDTAAAAKVRQDAIVKLLGSVNTESEFAIVTPGWKERATFYGRKQRGTVWGEIGRSVLQFKAFPYTMLLRGIDAVANSEGMTSKAGMTAFLITSTTLAGAMLMQTREMLSGKDPLAMTDERAWKFWGKAFLQGGALGIYGDFLYGTNQNRYGSGILESISGPTIGPLLELGLTQPMNAIAKKSEGKETHFLAQTAQDLKGFIPGGNIWYTKAALDHMVFQQVFEALSPGYLQSIRSRTMRDYGQDWWWSPGEFSPDRAPDLGRAAP